MNYAIIENESMCEDLERIACWLRENGIIPSHT